MVHRVVVLVGSEKVELLIAETTQTSVSGCMTTSSSPCIMSSRELGAYYTLIYAQSHTYAATARIRMSSICS